MKTTLIVLATIGVTLGLAAGGYYYMTRRPGPPRQMMQPPQPMGQQEAPIVQAQDPSQEKPLMSPPPKGSNMSGQGTSPMATKTMVSPLATLSPSFTPVPQATLIPDSVSTLDNPIKVPTSDGKEYFIVGYPAGQNSKTTKKILFDLPGHGTSAEQGYSVWKPFVTSRDYALATLNWWHGGGEKKTDYYSPPEVMTQIRAFLVQQGYTSDDFVVLFGFSRGSANTYSVKANDIVYGSPVIDAVISASGKYQSDFAMTEDMLNYNGGQLYAGVPWILACGVKDDNPERDGCIGMSETKTFLEGKGAKVLGLLEDPNGGHGAFHQSPLDLVGQAFNLLNDLPEAK